MVNFMPNGGSPWPAQQVVAHDSLITRPVNMTRTGYDFGGWFDDPACNEPGFDGDPWNFASQTVTTGPSLTLHARWVRQSYTVTFMADGGTPVPPIQTVLYDSLVSRPSPMTRAGWTFDGWYFGNSLWNFDTDKVYSNMILSARWIENPVIFTVTFVANSGDPAPPPQSVPRGARATEPPPMLRPGFGFGGWYPTLGLTGDPWVFARETVTTNMTLYARWETLTSTVSFVTGSIENPDPADQIIARTILDSDGFIIAQGGRVKEPPAMVRPGHIFGGWFPAGNFTGVLSPWNFADNLVHTETLILYARWIPQDTPPIDLIQRVRIHGVFYIDFAGNSITYNGPPVSPGTTWLTQEQINGNNGAVNSVVDMMTQHPDFIMQLSGHANPVTGTPQELDELIEISTQRSADVMRVFNGRGILNTRMINAGYNDRLYGDGSHGSLNRTVEIIIIEYLDPVRRN